MPKFSIIVPCYKEVFLKECIESILSQTYQDFELILVNDTSPYNIRQIVNQFKREFGIRKLLKKLVISLLFCNFTAENQ